MEDEDEDEMYEPLLGDVDVETLMEEDDLKIETGSRNELPVVQQEHPALTDQGKLAAQVKPVHERVGLLSSNQHLVQ